MRHQRVDLWSQGHGISWIGTFNSDEAARRMGISETALLAFLSADGYCLVDNPVVIEARPAATYSADSRIADEDSARWTRLHGGDGW